MITIIRLFIDEAGNSNVGCVIIYSSSGWSIPATAMLCLIIFFRLSTDLHLTVVDIIQACSTW